MTFDQPYRQVHFFGVWGEESADSFGKLDALKALDDVRDRCHDQDMRNDQTEAALTFLEGLSSKPWPFQSFRAGLDKQEPVNRLQSVTVALNAIRQALGSK